MATIRLTVLNSIKDVSGKLPILICISQKKNRSYIKTEFLIDDISEFHNGKVVYRKDAGIINKRLQFVLSQCREKFESIDCIDFLSASQIKTIITAKERPSHISFIEYWEKRICDFKEDGRDSYAKMNEDTIKMFSKAEGELPIPALNHQTVEHFYKWMLKNKYSIGGIGLRLSHLKARINELTRDGVLKTDIHPFAYTKIPSAEAKECDMSINEFRKIINSEPEGKKLNLAKDMILLSFYLCGMNLKDILSIDFREDIVSYERTKTKSSKKSDRNISIPVHPAAREIINRYITKTGVLELGYSYSYHNMQSYINLCMKELKKHLSIKSAICFYSARKTFAQFASELGIPDSIIDYCLGHSSKRRGIISYYARVKYKVSPRESVQKLLLEE